MDDKLIMTNILNTSKSICCLLNQGAIEANDTMICNVYRKVLNTCLSLQHDIYKTMQENGWYPVDQIKESDIKKIKKKFEINE